MNRPNHSIASSPFGAKSVLATMVCGRLVAARTILRGDEDDD
jgi:hypothetical protein